MIYFQKRKKKERETEECKLRKHFPNNFIVTKILKLMWEPYGFCESCAKSKTVFFFFPVFLGSSCRHHCVSWRCLQSTMVWLRCTVTAAMCRYCSLASLLVTIVVYYSKLVQYKKQVLLFLNPGILQGYPNVYIVVPFFLHKKLHKTIFPFLKIIIVPKLGNLSAVYRTYKYLTRRNKNQPKKQTNPHWWNERRKPSTSSRLSLRRGQVIEQDSM